MKPSAQERAHLREAFREMSPAERLDYLWAYYKGPILLGLAALLILTSVVARQLTRRTPAVYLALVNVSLGEEVTGVLTDGFLDASGHSNARETVYLYPGLYLSENPAQEYHQYSYASRMKLMGAVQARQLDLLLMNREAWELLSRSGYLLNLEEALPEALLSRAQTLLRTGEVVLEDNDIEYRLGEADSYQEVTAASVNALEVTALSPFAAAQMSDALYLGVCPNCPHWETALEYLSYLLEGPGR